MPVQKDLWATTEGRPYPMSFDIDLYSNAIINYAINHSFQLLGGAQMDNGWQEKQIDSIDQAIHLLSKLRIHKNSWLYRGTSNKYNKTLIPSIDR